MDKKLTIALKTARIIKRKFDAKSVFVLDNSHGEVSHLVETYVLATDEEMRDKFKFCDGFIVDRV